FRSAEGGTRGWCTNEWAFTHRRMVNEDDLACETTIGCWWLPADRYWLIEDDDGYASPTPHMDDLIATLDEEDERRISGAGQEKATYVRPIFIRRPEHRPSAPVSGYTWRSSWGGTLYLRTRNLNPPHTNTA